MTSGDSMVWDRPDADPSQRPETAWDLLCRRATEEPDRELVRFQDGRRLTLAQTHHGALEMAGRLAPLVRRGERVVTCIRPGPELVLTIFAVARLGAIEVPVDRDLLLPGQRHLLEEIPEALTLVDCSIRLDHPSSASSAPVVVVDSPAAGAPPLPMAWIRLADLPLDPEAAHRPVPLSGDPALILSTSGSTGRPKAAVLPHFAGVRHARSVVGALDYTAGDVLFNVFPWNHINVRHAALLPALISGARLVAYERFSASTFWQTCREEQVTAFNFMGVMAAILHQAPPDRQDRGHLVTRAYGGPAPAALTAGFLDRFGVALLEAYACTELGDVSVNTVRDWCPGTAGRPAPEYDLRIRGDQGQELPAGQPGSITVRPRLPDVAFNGYADGTGAWQQGWFAPGDRGYLDPDGRLHFVGRTADVIRHRGQTISAWEVEQALAGLPGLRDAAVVGLPSELTDEDLLLVVERSDPDLTEHDVREWCQRHLPRHALPRYVEVVEELPRNRTGKVRKQQLREMGVAAAAQEYHRPPGLPLQPLAEEQT